MNRTPLAILILGLFQIAHGQANGFCNLVWSDEFNDQTLSSAWTKEQTCYGGGNNEMQCYTARDKNVFLNNGNLVLKAVRETYTGSWNGCTDRQGCDWTKPYTSGRVNTARSQSWTYGRFETRAKIPSGYQLWPAIWMLPTDYKYGGWAASGEIDIMEARGNNPWAVSGTLHHGGSWPQNVWTTTGDHEIGVDLSADFHVYTVEWTANSLKWYVDNVMIQNYDTQRWWNSSAQNVYSAKGQPWDQRFHFILNLAVGGNFFGGAAPVTDAQSAAWAQPELRVDYVRVWQQGGNCGATPTSTPKTSTQAADDNNRPTPSTTTQPSQNGLCNGQGYDSSAYTCTINDVGNQVLCQVGQSACGGACYNPASYCCVSGGLTQKSMCPAITTTSRATTATSTTTRAATTAAPATSSSEVSTSCNGQGFNPSSHVCTTNESGLKVLCPVSEGNSCGRACYSRSNYCCSNGNLKPVGTC